MRSLERGERPRMVMFPAKCGTFFRVGESLMVSGAYPGCLSLLSANSLPMVLGPHALGLSLERIGWPVCSVPGSVRCALGSGLGVFRASLSGLASPRGA